MFRFAQVLTLTFLATPALAECPPRDAMEHKGLRFFNEGGDTETFTRREDGFILGVLEGVDGRTYSLLEKGIYFVEAYTKTHEGEIKNRLKYTFPIGWDDMPEPSHLGSFHMEALGEDAQGKFKEVQDYEFGEASVVFFGTCAFEMVPVSIQYDGAPERDIYHYLPHYNVSFLAFTVDADGTRTDYRYNNVEAVK